MDVESNVFYEVVFYFYCRPCFKSQLITLKKEGYWNELMDEKRPEIIVKDW